MMTETGKLYNIVSCSSSIANGTAIASLKVPGQLALGSLSNINTADSFVSFIQALADQNSKTPQTVL